MPNLVAVLRTEISRLARKEARLLVQKPKRASTSHRRDIAALKRAVGRLEKKVGFLEQRERERIAKPDVPVEQAQSGRFSPRWLLAHRKRLKLSAEEYARLAGVSTQSIYFWERGRSKPRRQALAALLAVRGLKRRQALQRLEVLGPNKHGQPAKGQAVLRKVAGRRGSKAAHADKQ